MGPAGSQSRARRGRGLPGGFRPGPPKPAVPRFAPVGSWRGLSPRAPPPSVFPGGLPLGARRPPPPSPPPGSAAASFRARLPWTAARWAAGTPPPPARARAKVSAAGGWGRGDGDSGAVGSSAGRAASAGEARREAARRKDAGTSGRAGEQPPLPVPHFRDRCRLSGFGKTESRACPPCAGGGRAGTRRACRAILRRERGESWRRGSPAARRPGTLLGERVPTRGRRPHPLVPQSLPQASPPAPRNPEAAPGKVQQNNSGLFWGEGGASALGRTANRALKIHPSLS